ncbi:class I SAM-dependent methyltransferase [Streptomyces sp. TRM 70351]|uniref:class I SAM-dependent methyltransferase n=1 Tax=Streptomyces sp. TRM 70351 TaxID=3116552 RepID=UPI002E7C079B|nr:class I SAM-dependent methyltransferase [Streptomyces sp. TRM 70351]MEE1931453.1 class I SAM-dependent methyltransferase [Streptomyces sp. TRM 70351]
MTGTAPEEPLDVNRRTWDLLTSVHVGSDFYSTEAVKAGRCSLKPVELTLAGDVRGLRLLHLQCHFGLDTLSWARRGAEVTGVDFSPAAIAVARAAAAETGIGARFETADVQDLPRPDEPYDLAVTTYGVLCWISDLVAWSQGIARSLKEGGRLVVVDFHPILEYVHPGKMTGAEGYFGAPAAKGVWNRGTYADQSADIEYREFRWQHTLADIATALLGAGLTLTTLREHPYSSYQLFEELTEERDGMWHTATGSSLYPFMFSLVAERTGR